MKKELQIKCDKINEIAKKKNLDSIMFFNHPDKMRNPNFLYMTNSDQFGLFVLAKNEPKLFSMGWKTRERPAVKTKHVERIKNLPKLKARAGIDKSYISSDIEILIKKTTGVRFVDISDEMEKIRSIKSANEINTIKDNCALAGKIYKKFEPLFHEHHEEIVAKARIELEMAKHGVYPSFPTLVAAKDNIIDVHHTADRTITEYPMLVDFGIRNRLYNTDATRTVGSRHEKIILQAIGDAESMLKHGTKVADIDKAVRKRLDSLQKYFTTSLGHGIGLAVHEYPRISSLSRDVLQEGMVITIEPGIYVKSGIRIENMYLIKRDGYELLTGF
ncbi:MAG: aminopeptidase P family protein [Candidatus Aenigmarchaeota archaeon]|nr:aminopeptidase P family protein [Candidatus Aenigmarchaeota archaeon]